MDEVWWSRLAQPNLHTWSDNPIRLCQKALEKTDEEPKALCCYGLLHPDSDAIWLRFIAGQPNSQATIAFLAWFAQRLVDPALSFFVLIWDNASWHKSQLVQAWFRAYNRKARRQGRVRLLPCLLPSKSPWLNPIEPHWVHGKRAIVEPKRVLTSGEIQQRVYDYFDCEPLPLIENYVL